ncbi:hypothetical protein PTKIN_Ptkin09bG0231100 [Pterospermum kingtungense]
MDSNSLETLQLSFGNLRVNNDRFAIDGSATPQGNNRVSSCLHMNGSSTGVLPGLGLSNRQSILDSSRMANFGPCFNVMNLNGAGYRPYSFAENPGYGSGEPYLYNVNNRSSLVSNGNYSGFSFHPEATPTTGNLLGYGFDIGTENSRGLRWNPLGIITQAMTEYGSKYFQDLLLKMPEAKNLIFEGVIEYIFQLMTNKYGRYLFKNLIESEDENQLRMIMEKLTASGGYIFYAVSIDRYGSCSIKRLIKVLEKSPLVTEVVKAVCNKFWELMTHPTGQFVIMECLDVVDSQKNELLYIEAISNSLKLATHERGCISLNSLITRIKGPRRDQLLNLICDHAAYLAHDPSGNFVVQCVLGLQNPATTDKICSKLRGHYVKLSMQKGGSHVVERCLRSSGMGHVVGEFLRSNQLVQIAKDQYGNYVVQTALKETKRRGSPLYGSLIEKLQRHLNSLQHGFGRSVFALVTASRVQQSVI